MRRESIQDHVSGVKRGIGRPESIQDHVSDNPEFEHILTVSLEVPEYHNTPEQNRILAALFANKKMGDKYEPTIKLEEGRRLRVSLFVLRKWPTLRDCTIFNEERKGLLLGAEGILLLSTEIAEELPGNKAILSLDSPESMWKKEENRYRVPAMYQSSCPKSKTDTFGAAINGKISDGNILLVFTYEDSADSE